MRFMHSAMHIDSFLLHLDKYMNAYAHLHDIEKIALVRPQAKIVPQPNSPANAQPTRPGTNQNDPNFHHRCKFCTDQDTCTRDDAAQDHMRKAHNYYDDRDDYLDPARDYPLLKRKHVDVLRAIIKKERAVHNYLISCCRIWDITHAVDYSIDNRDEHGSDLATLTQAELADKLNSERVFLYDPKIEALMDEERESDWRGYFDTLKSDWQGVPPA